MSDPSAGVPPPLLPHLHLTSTHRLPQLVEPRLETLVQYLISARRIVHHEAVVWRVLETPADGTLLLVWHPPALGEYFATDGYLWADQETSWQRHVGDVSVEMYTHKHGFAPGHDHYTIHARSRYRLLSHPSMPAANPNSPDADLWLVHYARANPQDHVPVNQLPPNPHWQQILSTRQQLKSMGQLAYREFMMDDRKTWPRFTLPGHPPPSVPQGPMRTALPPGARPPPGYQAAGQGPQHPQAAAGRSGPVRNDPSIINALAAQAGIELNDDGAHAYDTMTPREVSRLRFTQHTEWMEEVFSSPYATSQIDRISLGFGRTGELRGLTDGFFRPPVLPRDWLYDEGRPTFDKDSAQALGSDRAQEFRQHAEAFTQKLRDEMEAMREQHLRDKALLKRNAFMRKAEKALREAAIKPSDVGKGLGSFDPNAASVKVEHVTNNVEQELKLKIEPREEASLVQKGGMEERPSSEAPADGDTAMTEAADPTSILATSDIPPPDPADTDAAESVAAAAPDAAADTAATTTQPSGSSGPNALADDWMTVDKPSPDATAEATAATGTSEDGASAPAAAALGTDILDFGGDDTLGEADLGTAMDFGADGTLGDVSVPVETTVADSTDAPKADGADAQATDLVSASTDDPPSKAPGADSISVVADLGTADADTGADANPATTAAATDAGVVAADDDVAGGTSSALGAMDVEGTALEDAFLDANPEASGDGTVAPTTGSAEGEDGAQTGQATAAADSEVSATEPPS